MAKLIDMLGDVQEVHPKGSKYFTLQELYSLIGCEWVQVVPLRDGRSLWIDEVGKMNSKENVVATDMFRQDLLPGDYLAGNVLVDDAGEVD